MSTEERDLVARLGACDAVLDGLDKAIQKERARIPDAQSALEDASATLLAAEEALAESRSAEKALSRQVRTYEQRRAGAQRALEGGHGSADAAERQIQQVTQILDDLETQQLEQMDTTEAADAALDEARQAHQARAAELAQVQDASPPALAKLLATRAAAQLERDVAWEPVPTEVKNRYVLVRKKRKTAVALMDDGYCTACRRKAPLQEAADVRQGRLRSCANCGRYLVL